MTVPTRFVEPDEFHELMRQEGDVLPLFKLTAVPFEAPTPEVPSVDAEFVSVNVLLVNVSEPCLYRDRDAKMGFVLMNGYDSDTTFTYENFQDCHIVKNAWYYRLAPAYWEEGDPEEFDLDDAIFCFAPNDTGKWEKIGD